MRTVEFQSTIQNGMVVVPEAFREDFVGEVRVILMAESQPSPTNGFISDLMAQPIQLSGFRPLTREETHVR